MTLTFRKAGLQEWRVRATNHLNDTQQKSLENAQGIINVDTGAAASSLEVLPAREIGNAIVSEYNAGGGNLNPKSRAPTSQYVPILEARFQSVLTPHRDAWMSFIRRGFM